MNFNFAFSPILALFVLAIAASAPAQEKTAEPSPPTENTASLPEAPPFRNLDAALYMHSSAEYQAICLQAYNWATERVESQMAHRDDPRPAAVILDLDETALNNGSYQSWQIQQNYKFDEKKWAVWENRGTDYVIPVPGAQEFVAKLKELKVQPVYITNRNADASAETMKILQRFGMGVEDRFLMSAENKPGATNKTSRRAEVAAEFDIILLVGDNLRDFDEIFKYNPHTGVQGRKWEVDNRASYWGKRWILLPNPAYGEWTKPLGKGEEDVKFLMPAFPNSMFEAR